MLRRNSSESRSGEHGDRAKLFAAIGVLALEGLLALGFAANEAAQADITGVAIATGAGAVAIIATGIGFDRTYNRH